MGNTKYVIPTTAIALVALALGACSASEKTDGAPAKSTSTATATPTPSYNAATATDEEKWTEYQRLLELRGVDSDTYAVPKEEASKVSGNLCDNTASDMATFVDLAHVLYDDPSEFRVDKLETLAFTKAYCPEATALLETAYDSDEAEAEVAAAEPPKPADFTITIKIKRQKCFGSAGCNVRYTINPDYHGTADVSTGSYDITYQVTGGEDGPVINTFKLEDGTMTFDAEESVSTASSKTKLKAKVIEISAT